MKAEKVRVLMKTKKETIRELLIRYAREKRIVHWYR